MKFFYCILSLAIFSCSNNEPGKKPVAAEEKPKFPPRDSTKKKIILTFDDGPTVGSKKLYELLLKEQIPVALYLVGEHYDKMPAMHKLLDSLRNQPYITFANHSYSHAWHDRYFSYYSKPEAVIEEYLKVDTLIGINSHIARCAGRNVWRTALVNVTDDKGPGTAMDSLYKLGMQFTGWDYTWPYDYKTFKNTRDVAGMMNRIKLYFDSSFTQQPNYAIVLGHDQQFADDEDFKQLKDFIDSIKNSKIYEFVSVKEYPGIK